MFDEEQENVPDDLLARSSLSLHKVLVQIVNRADDRIIVAWNRSQALLLVELNSTHGLKMPVYQEDKE